MAKIFQKDLPNKMSEIKREHNHWLGQKNTIQRCQTSALFRPSDVRSYRQKFFLVFLFLPFLSLSFGLSMRFWLLLGK
jgi:hypothetical protein